MEPPATQPAPTDTNNYDFIINPEKPKSDGLTVGKNPFITKIIFLVGGTVVVLGVLAIMINLLFGSKTSIDAVTALVQTQQEIIRLSGEEKHAIDQITKNAAVNTGLALKTHQQKWIIYLDKHGTKLKKEQLDLKQDSKTDSKLKLAVQTSTFDPTYNAVMRARLTAYAKDLKTTYNGMSSKQQRAQLNDQYKEVALLLKQWPEPPSSQ